MYVEIHVNTHVILLVKQVLFNFYKCNIFVIFFHYNLFLAILLLSTEEVITYLLLVI